MSCSRNIAVIGTFLYNSSAISIGIAIITNDTSDKRITTNRSALSIMAVNYFRGSIISSITVITGNPTHILTCSRYSTTISTICDNSRILIISACYPTHVITCTCYCAKILIFFYPILIMPYYPAYVIFTSHSSIII